MAHYATLRDYHFSEDADDVRGANVYGIGSEKLGIIDDVVFDHENGEIRYLVVEARGRKHLLPADRIYRSVIDENEFDTFLTRAELESLPEFDEAALRSEHEWSEHQKRHSKAYKEFEKAQEERYQQSWHASPVQHRHGSSRDITPEPDEMPSGGEGQRIVTGADLTPQRLAGKFPEAAPTPAKITQSIAGTPIEASDAAHTAMPLSPRWERFRDHLRANIGQIRQQCSVCCERRAA